jgi:hypothetical protein
MMGTEVHRDGKAAAHERQPLRQILGHVPQQKVVPLGTCGMPVPACRQQLAIENGVSGAQREPRDCSGYGLAWPSAKLE